MYSIKFLNSTVEWWEWGNCICNKEIKNTRKKKKKTLYENYFRVNIRLNRSGSVTPIIHLSFFTIKV